MVEIRLVMDVGTQIIWAMIRREYLGILIVSLPPAVSYIYTISALQKNLSSHRPTLYLIFLTPFRFSK